MYQLILHNPIINFAGSGQLCTCGTRSLETRECTRVRPPTLPAPRHKQPTWPSETRVNRLQTYFRTYVSCVKIIIYLFDCFSSHESPTVPVSYSLVLSQRRHVSLLSVHRRVSVQVKMLLDHRYLVATTKVTNNIAVSIQMQRRLHGPEVPVQEGAEVPVPRRDG